jgi:hypothetical protein
VQKYNFCTPFLKMQISPGVQKFYFCFIRSTKILFLLFGAKMQFLHSFFKNANIPRSAKILFLLYPECKNFIFAFWCKNAIFALLF